MSIKRQWIIGATILLVFCMFIWYNYIKHEIPYQTGITLMTGRRG